MQASGYERVHESQIIMLQLFTLPAWDFILCLGKLGMGQIPARSNGICHRREAEGKQVLSKRQGGCLTMDKVGVWANGLLELGKT